MIAARTSAMRSGESLQEHLLWQLEMEKLGPRQRDIGRAVIDAINEDGYLIESIDEIAATLRPDIEADEDEIETVLALVQRLTRPASAPAIWPTACCCNWIASIRRRRALRWRAALPPSICRCWGSAIHRCSSACSTSAMTTWRRPCRWCAAAIRKPGSQISSARPEYIVPDVFVRRARTAGPSR
jgi:RNA polymerase sigma-54 factor